jgi:hypothetical protein
MTQLSYPLFVALALMVVPAPASAELRHVQINVLGMD